MNNQEKIILETLPIDHDQSLTVKDLVILFKARFSLTTNPSEIDLLNKTCVNRVVNSLLYRGLLHKTQKFNELPRYSKITNVSDSELKPNLVINNVPTKDFYSNIVKSNTNNNNIINTKPHNTSTVLDNLTEKDFNITPIDPIFVIPNQIKQDVYLSFDKTFEISYIKRTLLTSNHVFLNVNEDFMEENKDFICKPINSNLNSHLQVIEFLREKTCYNFSQQVILNCFKQKPQLDNYMNFIFAYPINSKVFFFDTKGFYSTKLMNYKRVFHPSDFMSIMSCNSPTDVLMKSVTLTPRVYIEGAFNESLFNLNNFLTSSERSINLDSFKQESVQVESLSILRLCSIGFLNIINGSLIKGGNKLDSEFLVYKKSSLTTKSSNYKVYIFIRLKQPQTKLSNDFYDRLVSGLKETSKLSIRVESQNIVIIASKLLTLLEKSLFSSFATSYLDSLSQDLSYELH